MIRCTLTLCPGGLEGQDVEEHLGTIYIANDMTRTLQTRGKRGSYKYKLMKKRQRVVSVSGVIADFPRLSYHPWNLVRRILNDAADIGNGTI